MLSASQIEKLSMGGSVSSATSKPNIVAARKGRFFIKSLLSRIGDN